VHQHSGRIELYIDTVDAAKNNAYFDHVEHAREQSEQTLGKPLIWERLDAKQASRISYPVTTGGYRDVEQWAAIQDDLIDAMIRLDAALRPHSIGLPV
jgi:hypothetical protein